MANEQNLKPLNTRAKSVQREIQSKGGKARAKKIKEQKTLKEELLTALALVVKDNKTVQEIGVEELLKKFMQGDPKVFEIVRDSIGQKPTDKVENLNKNIIIDFGEIPKGDN